MSGWCLLGSRIFVSFHFILIFMTLFFVWAAFIIFSLIAIVIVLSELFFK